MLFTPSIWIPRFGAAGPPLDGFSGITSALSLSRDLLTSFSSARYTLTGGAISEITDQSGSGNHAHDVSDASARPALVTAGPNSRAAADFDGANNYLQHGTLAELFTASEKYMILSFITDAYGTDNTSAGSIYNNEGPYISGWWGLALTQTGPSVRGFNYTSSAEAAFVLGTPSTGTPVVAELYLESNTLYGRINGGSWVSSASGTTGNTALRMWVAYANFPWDGKIFEIITANEIPSENQRDALHFNMLEWIAG